ncbi:SDR family NAD(P)-dependent oxidoreductase [Spongiibacter sp. KMU-158]|uniref:SDR family NAD(P)-dependent oxidoreductase n=1 Tax=Spongiibacter pelagi TaxID=2760804 RepID=A0A927GWV1_9GAMM|nr:oxidoreductase [Spongiibacter pelagi]MBD2859850.1 SDR family NAD(P)-dependent oxidoreductase [Spongiibacter pelagi]
MKGWTPSEIPDLTGKRAMITGANSGIGYQTALMLAQRGARVWLGCRNAERAEAAIQRLEKALGSRDLLTVLPMDLASLDSVQHAAEQYLALNQPLDLLINNAGIMGLPLQRTCAGHEMLLAVNHLAHFALTASLLPALEAAPKARVVTISSLAAKSGVLDFDDLNWERSPYNKVAAYARAKLANQCFAIELQRRLQAAGSSVISLAAHPGYAATNVAFSNSETRSLARRLWQSMVRIGNALLAQSAERGALPSVYAATSETLQGGEYIGPSGPFQLRGTPSLLNLLPSATDKQTGEHLWRHSEQMTRTRYL